jgi:probable DNA metabolism protein
MTEVIYDGSWIGFLSSVFEIYERKLSEVSLCGSVIQKPSLFANESLAVFSDEKKARRVWMGLQNRLSVKALGDIYRCFLSELPGIENHLLAYIRFSIATPGAEFAYGQPCILKVSQVSKMVYREKHRMEAFVRFKLTKDKLYFASVDPDFNVLPLLVKHFKNRYADQRWLIMDQRRHYGIFYDLETVAEVTLDLGENLAEGDCFSEEEASYQTLWKEYFEHVNIPERKNTKLHLRHVPKRYWKNLTEKWL